MRRNRENPEYLEKLDQGWSRSHSANKLEEFLAKHYFEALHYVGDGHLWVTLKDGRRKCPDFKVHGQRKFIEIWGDYWHKGEDPENLIEAYREIGFSCLVVWESEVHNDWRNTVKKINMFLNS